MAKHRADKHTQAVFAELNQKGSWLCDIFANRIWFTEGVGATVGPNGAMFMDERNDLPICKIVKANSAKQIAVQLKELIK